MLIHASTKVFIFILFGYVISLTGGIRDIRKMGGLYNDSFLLSFSIWGLSLLSSLPLFFLPLLKDTLILSLLNLNFFFDLSIFFFMVSSVLNYLYVVRLFFKIFFGDFLSFSKTYFGSIFFFGSFLFGEQKYLSLRSINNPIFYIFIYILLLESNTFLYFEFDYFFFEISFFDLNSSFVANAAMKYSAYSNS